MTSSEGNSKCLIRGKQKRLASRSDLVICYIAHFEQPQRAQIYETLRDIRGFKCFHH